VTTDPTSILVIGGGRGTAGAVTVAAGATLSGNGSVNPFAAILDNGLIDAAGSAGTLTLGTVTGTGTLLISAGAALELMSPTAVAIDFAAQSGSLYPVLDLASELALPTGTLSGLAPGDVIDVLGDPITSVAIARNTNGPSVLTLFYGSTVVGRISLLGGFAHQVFVAEPDASDGTDIVLVQQAGGGGGGGTGNTDTLAWATPGSGAWSRAGNWTDLTTGAAATAAPGAENQVIVGGPTGGAVQALGGPGTCSSLLFTGNTLLNGTFTTTTLTIGTVSAAGTLDEVGGDQLAATTATLAAGELSLTNASTGASIAGTLSIGGSASALLSVTSTAQLQAGALVLGAGGSVSVDATGSIEIGTLGGAAGGALTIDPRAVVSGAGTLNAAGTIIDNGSIEAIGGTLTVGAVSGAGTLDIGAEATLVLAVADPGASACQIVIQGGGATLDLAFPFAAGAQPLPSIIAGFAPGDALVIANAPITGVSVTQGSGLATLTLSYGAQNAATLLLAGNFANDSFAVQPDGAGSEITVTPSSGGTGPSAGTPSPDDYFWSGADTVSGGTAWNDAGNWNDASASQTPALIAPGLNDLVTIQGASGSGVLAIQGPGNAASLTLLGNVALAGAFAVGGLTVDAGILALGAGTGLVASAAEAVGGIEVQGGTLSVAGALDLAGGSGSLLVADAGASASIGTLFMTQGSAVLADATSSIGIGGVTAGTPGDVTVASGGRVSGAGALDVLGAVTDDGTITAAGGTLSVGALSGDGTLPIGQGATLGLEGPAGSGLIIDFAANGTLSATVTPAAAIAGFGTSDAILLPFPDATGATYAPTDAGAGLLTITDGSAVLGVLTLLGMNADSAFSVTGAAGGGTELTTTTAQNGSSGGGSTVSGSTTPGGQVETDIDAFIDAQSSWGEQALYAALATIDPASEPFYVWTAPGGQGWGGPNYFDVNIAFASDPAAYDAEWMPYGYQVLIASGNNPVYLVDGGSGHSLLIGNAGNDSITGLGQDDTMFGGAGTNTDFWAAGAATMVGGGNDTFVAQNGAVDVTTSANGRSSAWLGNTGGSLVTLNGSDTVAFGGTGGGSDTVVSAGNAGDRSLIVGPDVGLMTYQCGPGPATIVGHAGSMSAVGAGGSNFVIGGFGANSYLSYTGGSGGALVVGETGTMWIDGGAGAVTIFGGTGAGHYSAEPGPSYFVVGDGPSTIFATSGNTVWLEGGADVTTYVNGGGVIAWGANSTGNNVFQAGSGPSTLAGGMGSDLFLASTGNATLAGGSGVETFSFTKGQAGGHDLVQNFAIGRDVIALNGYGETPAMILAAETVSGGSTYLVLGDGTHITVSGVTGLTTASFTG
jgi:Ca2+-binding RTX toxin-like protein